MLNVWVRVEAERMGGAVKWGLRVYRQHNRPVSFQSDVPAEGAQRCTYGLWVWSIWNCETLELRWGSQQKKWGQGAEAKGVGDEHVSIGALAALELWVGRQANLAWAVACGSERCCFINQSAFSMVSCRWCSSEWRVTTCGAWMTCSLSSSMWSSEHVFST